MAVSEMEIARYAKLYTEATGKTPSRFVCPITLRDDPDADLCDGHIVCKAIEEANRATIPQRADVDNLFGSLVERDFVSVANIVKDPPEKLLKRVKYLKITSPNGDKMETFFSGNHARDKFQQIELYDDTGKVIASPFLKHHVLENRFYKQMEVEYLITVNKYAFTAGMIKSGYLAMFKMLGYAYILNAAGDKVRRTFAAAIQETDSRSALSHFAEWEGAAWVVFNDAMDTTNDTLANGTMFAHYMEGDCKTGLMFATSCLFWINGKLMCVTLPAYNRDGYYFVAWEYYRKFIADHTVRQNVHLARFVDNVVQVAETPLSLKATSKFPPDSDSMIPISPLAS